MLTDILIEKLNFTGVVCTDWGVVDQRHYGLPNILGGKLEMDEWHGILTDVDMTELEILEFTTKLIIDAGADQFGIWHWEGNEIEALLNLVKAGQISEKRIDHSVRKILRNKFMLGLFENPFVDPERAGRLANEVQQSDAKLAIEQQSIVMLKNNGVLPLDINKKPSVFFSMEGIIPDNNSVKIVEKVSDADVVLVKVKGQGENYINLTPETGLLLPDSAILRIEDAIKSGKSVVLCLVAKNPVIIPNNILENVSAILLAWNDNANALIEVALGEVSPSGKLPYDMPSSIESTAKQLEDIPFDLESPSFVFGHGLSYSSFEYSDLDIQDVDDNEFKLSFKITNTSQVDGSEVAQLYTKREGQTIKLAGFEKLSLQAGESKVVTLVLDEENLGALNHDLEFVLEPGSREVLLGSSRKDIRLMDSLIIE